MPLIDAAYAWRFLCDAARGQAAHAPTGGFRTPPLAWHEPSGAEPAWQAPGGITAEAAEMLERLGPVARGGPDLVVAQLGQSLDGRIATASGHSHYVTGEASRGHLHALRALVDGVIVGAGTVAADDPQLTVRHVSGTNPVRIVLDPSGRLRNDHRLFCDGGPPTWHLVGEDVVAVPGRDVIRVSRGTDGRVSPSAILAALAERGVRRLLVEGGGQTISAFIDAGRVDRLHTVVAPMLIGSGRPALSLAEIATLADARRPVCHEFVLGADRLYDLDLRRSAAPAE